MIRFMLVMLVAAISLFAGLLEPPFKSPGDFGKQIIVATALIAGGLVLFWQIDTSVMMWLLAPLGMILSGSVSAVGRFLQRDELPDVARRRLSVRLFRLVSTAA